MEEKIFGIYTGNLDITGIDEVAEIDIWKKIDNLGGIIWRINHEVADGRLTLSQQQKQNLLEYQYALEYLVYYTRKFGVEFTQEPQKGLHVEHSSDYLAWFRFWHNHFNSMSREEYNAFVDKKQNGEDISGFLPSTTWKEALQSNVGL